MNDATKSYRVDRGQAEQFQARHLLVWGGPTASRLPVSPGCHSAVSVRSLPSRRRVCRQPVILSEKRLLDWLIQEARQAHHGKRGLLLCSGEPLRAGIGSDADCWKRI